MTHQFPAPPNQSQFVNEPPRLVADYPSRKDEIESLGNAVVPQVVYPIFKYLYEKLSEDNQHA